MPAGSSLGTPISVCVLNSVPGASSKNGNSGSVQPRQGMPERVDIAAARIRLDDQELARYRAAQAFEEVRLVQTGNGREKTVELTKENAYLRAKRF